MPAGQTSERERERERKEREREREKGERKEREREKKKRERRESVRKERKKKERVRERRERGKREEREERERLRERERERERDGGRGVLAPRCTYIRGEEPRKITLILVSKGKTLWNTTENKVPSSPIQLTFPNLVKEQVPSRRATAAQSKSKPIEKRWKP